MIVAVVEDTLLIVLGVLAPNVVVEMVIPNDALRLPTCCPIPMLEEEIGPISSLLVRMPPPLSLGQSFMLAITIIILRLVLKGHHQSRSLQSTCRNALDTFVGTRWVAMVQICFPLRKGVKFGCKMALKLQEVDYSSSNTCMLSDASFMVMKLFGTRDTFSKMPSMTLPLVVPSYKERRYDISISWRDRVMLSEKTLHFFMFLRAT